MHDTRSSNTAQGRNIAQGSPASAHGGIDRLGGLSAEARRAKCAEATLGSVAHCNPNDGRGPLRKKDDQSTR